MPGIIAGDHSMATISSTDLLRYVGTNIGTVTLVKLLGQGSMGAVFVGYQTTLKRQVAVKILPKSLANSPKAQKMFRDEAETIGILNHPNIVPVYEMGETSDFFFQIMQLIAGNDLRTLLVRARKHPVPTKRILPFSETIHYLCQVLDALEYAHDEGVVHQDIKPANILIDDRFKRPIVADFGIARTVWAEYSASSSLFGTPLYISPEQAARSETDGRTDMYAVGVILMEMVAGVLPVRSESPADMIQRKKTDPDSFFTATASLPANRFADCLEFKVALETYTRTRGLS